MEKEEDGPQALWYTAHTVLVQPDSDLNFKVKSYLYSSDTKSYTFSDVNYTSVIYIIYH